MPTQCINTETFETDKKWLANIESDGTIETTGVTDITEVLIILDRMKQEAYDYREQAACEDLKKLYHIKVPVIQKNWEPDILAFWTGCIHIYQIMIWIRHMM